MNNMSEKDWLIFLIVIFIGISLWLYYKLEQEKKRKKKLSKDYAQLLADNALLEAEQLKFQLQPHTLNNILANLKVIANKLNKGMDSLSETLEYILYKGNNHWVSIEDELTFIRKYLKLNDLFITEIDSIKLDDSKVNKHSKHYAAPCIPHLITAYFIENAFKHGDINHPEFLKIEVKLSDTQFELTVTNKTKHKPVKPEGGLGLKNMNKRLELLLSDKYEINNDFDDEEYSSSLIIYFTK